MPYKLPTISSIHTVAFDFDGIFTNNKVLIDQDGRESVQCDRSDGLAFDLVRAFQKRGLLHADFFIITTESNPVVLARAKKLNLVCYHGIQNKLAFLEENLSLRFPDEKDFFTGLIYLGNDLNDLSVMKKAGFAIAPCDAHPCIKEIANLVIANRGGEGVVRTFVEEWLEINKLTTERLDEFISDR